ncbi:hypothetical protein Q5752_004498 [Cryptotrichosporon argae]
MDTISKAKRATASAGSGTKDFIHAHPTIFWPVFGAVCVLVLVFCLWCLYRGPNRALWPCVSRAKGDAEAGLEEKGEVGQAQPVKGYETDKRRTMDVGYRASLAKSETSTEAASPKTDRPAAKRTSVLVKPSRKLAAVPSPSSSISEKYPPSPASTMMSTSRAFPYSPTSAASTTSTLVLAHPHGHASSHLPVAWSPEQPSPMPRQTSVQPAIPAAQPVVDAQLSSRPRPARMPSSKRKQPPPLPQMQSHASSHTATSPYIAHATQPDFSVAAPAFPDGTHGHANSYPTPAPVATSSPQLYLPPSTFSTSYASPSRTTWYSSTSSAYSPAHGAGLPAPTATYGFGYSPQTYSPSSLPQSPQLFSSPLPSTLGSPNPFFQRAFERTQQFPVPPTHTPARSVDLHQPSRPAHMRSASSPLAHPHIRRSNVEAALPLSPRTLRKKMGNSVASAGIELIEKPERGPTTPTVHVLMTDERTGRAV